MCLFLTTTILIGIKRNLSKNIVHVVNNTWFKYSSIAKIFQCIFVPKDFCSLLKLFFWEINEMRSKVFPICSTHLVHRNFHPRMTNKDRRRQFPIHTAHIFYAIFVFKFQKGLLHNSLGLLVNCNDSYWVSNKINPCAVKLLPTIGLHVCMHAW